MKKLVINICFGGFHLPKEFCEKYGFEEYGDIDRDDKRLVDWMEEHENKWHETGTKLRVVTLPDETTDYFIDEYDGAEQVIYVVGGKLHWA